MASEFQKLRQESTNPSVASFISSIVCKAGKEESRRKRLHFKESLRVAHHSTSKHLQRSVTGWRTIGISASVSPSRPAAIETLQARRQLQSLPHSRRTASGLSTSITACHQGRINSKASLHASLAVLPGKGQVSRIRRGSRWAL